MRSGANPDPGDICPKCLTRPLERYTKWGRIYKRCPDRETCKYMVMIGWVR